MICTSCHCTEEKPCLVDGKPCAWFATDIPLCTVCVDRSTEQLVVGAKVRITFGNWKGRLGTITQIPKLYPERRCVRRYGVTSAEQFHVSALSLEKA